MLAHLDVKHIADAIAPEVTNKRCIANTRTIKNKTVRSYFRNQLYRSWGLGPGAWQPTADGHASYPTAGAW